MATKLTGAVACHPDAFSGNKNSGKSTLTISQVLWKDCQLVSDDVTFVGIDGNNNAVCDGIFNGVHIEQHPIC